MRTINNLLVLTFLLILVNGCGMLQSHKTKRAKPKKKEYKTISERRLACVEKFIKLDVKPLQAKDICVNIHNQR